MVKKKFISIVATLGLVLALALVPVTPPVMADEDTATGSFTVGNAVPTVGTPTVTSPSDDSAARCVGQCYHYRS